MVEGFSREFGEYRNEGVDIVAFHPQLVEFCGGAVRFVSISPRFDEGEFEIVVNSYLRVGGSRAGQNPNLRISFPFVDFGACHIGQGVGDFSMGVGHNGMHGVHELVKAEFVKEFVGLFSVSVEDGRFLSLEEFFISLDWVRLWW